MSAVLALALGWEFVGSRDVGDMVPTWYADYRTPDGRIVNAEPPYFNDAVAVEIRRLRAEVERMRPVIEAAGVWFDEDDALEAVSDWLAAAVARYRIAVAALDAGEPPQ